MRRLLFALVTACAVTSCAQQDSGWEEPSASAGEEAAMPLLPPPDPGGDAGPMRDVVERNRQELLATSGVVGVGSGLTPAGEDAVIVWTTDGRTADHLPTEVDGYPVIVHVVPGGFRPF
jgi:hypothetical protein